MATVLDLSPITPLTREQFYQLCMANRDTALERTVNGELVIVSPIGGKSGYREADLIAKVVVWNEQTGLGVVFSSSTVFSLPVGSDRSPDVAWVAQERWEALTEEQREKFPPLCPDFVIELRPRTDRLKPLQAKMQEYIDNGASLGWLIDPIEKQVYVYQPNATMQQLNSPTTLSGDSTLSGFVLDLSKIW